METQTFMISWNLIIKCKNKVQKIDIYTPQFSLNPSNKNDKIHSIRLERFGDKLKIDSNILNIKEFKTCTTYMMKPLSNTIEAEFNGFDTFSWNHNELKWNEVIKFVFEVKMHCTAVDPPVIWQHFDTETKTPINNNDILLGLLEADTMYYIVRNNRGHKCIVKRISYMNNYHTISIRPEETTENWNLLTRMLKKLENNVWEWQYQHTTNVRPYGRYFAETTDVIVVEIMELTTINSNE